VIAKEEKTNICGGGGGGGGGGDIGLGTIEGF